MASQQDLQELLRILTARKMTMMAAMSQVKALQAANLRSIAQIADSPLSDLESIIKDVKAAKSLQSACKTSLKKASGAPTKRPATSGAVSASSKRPRHSADPLDAHAPVSPQELEASLELPLCTDEDDIAQTVLETNRAPLVLAFAVELLRHTMPEQPPSSRLSLAQAVVSANSRSKAVSLGLDHGSSAESEGWGEGQPRVKVMGRDIAVLKRGGYEWRGDEVEQAHDMLPVLPGQLSAVSSTPPGTTSWVASQPVTLKGSTFIARVAPMSEASQRPFLLRSLFDIHPEIETATHNAWAYRIRPPSTAANPSGLREDSFDDGETGCGDLLSRILGESNVVDVLLVLTRWFGGTLLGPDRWRLMRNCANSALAQRLRMMGRQVILGGVALWGLDLEAMRSASSPASQSFSSQGRNQTDVVGMPIHRPEAARNYLFKSFTLVGSPEDESTANGNKGDDQGRYAHGPARPKNTGYLKVAKRTRKDIEYEKEESLGRVLGALRILFDSWADHLSASELDHRAWGWYVAVRPDVANGPAGWGAKGSLELRSILRLKRGV